MTSKTKLIKVSKTNAFNLNQRDVSLMVNYLKKFIKVKDVDGIKTVHSIDFKLFFENMKSAKLSQLRSYSRTTTALLNIYKQIGDSLSKFGFTEDDYYIVYLMTQTAAPHVDAGWEGQNFFSKVLNITGCEYYQFETFYTEQVTELHEKLHLNKVVLHEDDEFTFNPGAPHCALPINIKSNPYLILLQIEFRNKTPKSKTALNKFLKDYKLKTK